MMMRDRVPSWEMSMQMSECGSLGKYVSEPALMVVSVSERYMKK